MKIIKKKFDNRCFCWDENSLINECFLKNQQIMANCRLMTRGWLFLRDIYDSIGLPLTQESCVLGWHKDAGSEKVLFGFSPIVGTNDYELTFDCYPILEYLEKEG